MESNATPLYIVLFELWAASKTLAQMFDGVLRRYGLGSGRELAALGLLVNAREVSPSEVASRTGMPAPTVTAFLRRLEERGYISRRPNPADGRSYLFSLSKRGRPRLEAAFEECTDLFTRIEAEMAMTADEVHRAIRSLDDAMRDATGLDRRTPA